eukprot:9397-Eustigmatos_ZCMA.PRE.1
MGSPCSEPLGGEVVRSGLYKCMPVLRLPRRLVSVPSAAHIIALALEHRSKRSKGSLKHTICSRRDLEWVLCVDCLEGL